MKGGAGTEGILEFLQAVVEDGCELSPQAEALIAEVKVFSETAEAILPKEMEFPVPALQENGVYRYYSTQRPVDLGTFPKPPDNPVVRIHNYDANSRIPVEKGMIQAWGYVEYQRPLTEKQADDYELRPAPARFTEKEVAERIKPDIAQGKADIQAAKPDIGQPEAAAADRASHETEKSSVLQDLVAKKPKTREQRSSRKPKKQKEESR